MRNIKFPMALLCLFLTINMIAQSPRIRKFSSAGVLENAQTMPTNAIADDFGPRDYGSTKWHGGIDFNSAKNDGDNDFWDLIISPQAGIIADFDRLTHGQDRYKYGLVNITDDEGNGSHTLLFGHVFDWNHQFYDEFGSRIVLKRCEGINFLKWGLHLNFTDNAGNVIRHTYGQVDGAILKVNGVNYTTTNEVNTNDVFIPLGKSGGTPDNRYNAHLHLNTLPFNTATTGYDMYASNGDPTQFLNIDRPNYNIYAWSKNNTIMQGVKPQYPGTDATKVKVRVEMDGEQHGVNRYNKLMDMDKVELQIKKETASNFARIKGDKIEAFISEGGRLGESVINHKSPVNKFNWLSTGIHSNAYNAATSGNNEMSPWDEYFFTDFYTRIHKNDILGATSSKLLADIPANARYNDGWYDFRVKTTTSNNGITYSNIQPITLDNFQPYLTRINVNCNNSALYQVHRKADEGKNNINDDGTLNNDITNYSISANPSSIYAISLEIYTSEPMKDLKCAHRLNNGPTIFSEDINMTKSSSNELKWTVILPLSYVMEDCVQLRFKGKDLSDNDLIDVYSSTNSNDILSKMLIPTRSSLTSWNNTPAHTGVDYVDFCLKTCSAFRSDDIASTRSNPCDLLNDVEADVSIHHCKSGTIELLLQNPTDYDVSWTDQDGNDLYQYQNTTQIHVQTSTTLCYHITPLSECCKKSQCIEVILENFDLNVQVEEVVKECGCENKKAYVEINATNLQGFQYDYKYYWQDFPNINSYSRSLNIGSYKVSVTDDFGCFHEHIVTIHDFESSFNIVEDINNSSCYQDDGSIDLEIEALIDGTIPDLKISWSNGVQGTSIANLSHGEYCVTITQVFNNDCKIIKCYTVDRERISIDAEITPTCLTEGSIEPQISGGTEPYSYSWSNDENTKNIYNLAAGTYYLLVEDVNGCWETAEFEVEVNDKIVVISNFTNLLDCNIPNGSIQITPLISEHINYQWFNSLGILISTNKDISNLERGTYRLIATSDSGCQTTLVQSICCCNPGINPSDPSACYIGFHSDLTVTGITTHTTNGLDNGSIVLSILGGKGQTIFSWIGPNGFTSFDKDIFNLEIGQYTVTVTDGCQTIVRTFIITDESICENANLTLTGTTKCIIIGVSPGIVTTNVSGGTPPYTYYWSFDGSTDQNYSSYYQGSTVRVTDSNGCTISEYFSLSKSNPLKANFEILNPGDCSSKIDKLLIKVNCKAHLITVS